MKCEKCNERDATVLYKQTINGESTTMHLCAECAGKAQEESGFGLHFPTGNELFGSLFSIAGPGHTYTTKKCEGCGATFADIRRTGKVCCPACYSTFAKELEPTVRSLYGTAIHTGRAPAKNCAVRDKKKRLEALKKDLQAAIQEERFEDAATLRDEIRILEKEGE